MKVNNMNKRCYVVVRERSVELLPWKSVIYPCYVKVTGTYEEAEKYISEKEEKKEYKILEVYYD